jgi:transcriptional regulator with XRE-family HTH domain
LIALRKERGLTQQALADLAGLHVVQIGRWEKGSSQPSIEALVKLARGLRTSTDHLLFSENERGPEDGLRIQFEATQRLTPEEQNLVREFLDAILLKHDARRWTAAKS